MSEIPGEGVVSLGTGFSVRSTPASVERTESAFPSRATSPAPTGGARLFPDKLRVRWAHERLVSGMTQCRSVYPSSTRAEPRGRYPDAHRSDFTDNYTGSPREWNCHSRPDVSGATNSHCPHVTVSPQP